MTALNYSSLAIKSWVAEYVYVYDLIWLNMDVRRTKGSKPQLHQKKGHNELGKGQYKI